MLVPGPLFHLSTEVSYFEMRDILSSLKEELKKVLGATEKQRFAKVWASYSLSKNKPLWGGTEKFNPANDQFYKQLLNSLNESFWERKLGTI